eukprot:5491028-Prymnesium_polylepis.1
MAADEGSVASVGSWGAACSAEARSAAEGCSMGGAECSAGPATGSCCATSGGWAREAGSTGVTGENIDAGAAGLSPQRAASPDADSTPAAGNVDAAGCDARLVEKRPVENAENADMGEALGAVEEFASLPGSICAMPELPGAAPGTGVANMPPNPMLGLGCDSLPFSVPFAATTPKMPVRNFPMKFLPSPSPSAATVLEPKRSIRSLAPHRGTPRRVRSPSLPGRSFATRLARARRYGVV